MHQANLKSQNSTPSAANFFAKAKVDQDEGIMLCFYLNISMTMCGFIIFSSHLCHWDIIRTKWLLIF